MGEDSVTPHSTHEAEMTGSRPQGRRGGAGEGPRSMWPAGCLPRSPGLDIMGLARGDCRLGPPALLSLHWYPPHFSFALPVRREGSYSCLGMGLRAVLVQGAGKRAPCLRLPLRIYSGTGASCWQGSLPVVGKEQPDSSPGTTPSAPPSWAPAFSSVKWA